jgi:hypothetical protein
MLATVKDNVNPGFRERLAAARRHRSQSVARAGARLETLYSLHKGLHEELDRHVSNFNNPSRLRDTARLYAERKPAGAGITLPGSKGPFPSFSLTGAIRFRTMEIGTKDHRRVLPKAPTKRDLGLYFFPEEVPWVHGSLKAILAFSRHAETIRATAEAVAAALAEIPQEVLGDAELYSPVPPPPFLSPADRIKHQERELAQAAVVMLLAANGCLDAVEAELDEACMSFNGVIKKYRRRGKLLCYWEVNPPVRIDTCRTVKGPTFYTLSMGKAMLTRVRTGGTDPRHPRRNVVTQALIRQCFLGRYADPYLEQAAVIEELRSRRLRLISALQTTVRALRGSSRIKQEISYE